MMHEKGVQQELKWMIEEEKNKEIGKRMEEVEVEETYHCRRCDARSSPYHPSW